jgi:hypothetical protein
MQWYYSQNGAQTGPVTQEELTAMVASGRVRSDELVWTEGMANWLPAYSVPQLRSAPIPGAPPLPPSDQVQNPYSPPLAPAQSVYSGQPIPTYLWQSIVVTFLCCLPFGIPAIVYAAKVEGLVRAGNLAGALEASANAKKWTWISFWVGIFITILWILASILGAAAGAAGANGAY